jgi:cell division protein FtsL
VSGSRAASSVSGEPDSGRKTASSAYGEPSFGDRTASSIYGDQASGHRAGRSVFGGLLDDAPPPPSERRHERRRKQAAGQGVRISRYSRPALPHISAAEKGILIFVAAFVAAALVGVIALEAYSVSIQHGINKKNTERAAIQKDIDELYVAIEQGSNISVIEKRAEKDLKMRYPAQDQLKYGKDIAAEVADAGASEGAKS